LKRQEIDEHKNAELEKRLVELLRLNHLTLQDMAKFTNGDYNQVRRTVDTLSLSEPIFEVRHGVYGLLPKDFGE
jgi:hypothetical protein